MRAWCLPAAALLTGLSALPSHGAVTATLVKMALTAPNAPPDSTYDSATVTRVIDPARTRWVAWNATPAVERTDGSFPNRTFLWGGGGFGTDDSIRLTITNPTGASLTVEMDKNNALGAHADGDPMQVIFGTAADAPDALRIDAFGPTAGMRRVYNEAGAFGSIFTASGTYTFRFEFRNLTGGAGHSDIHLLADVTEGSSSGGGGGGAETPGPCLNFPLNLVPLESIYYVSQANAARDRLVVGRLGGAAAAKLRTLQSIPLPNLANQVFCGQVQLAPGQLFDVYVPTTAERAGNFSAFSGLLRDPVNNQPFAGGVIPAARLGDPYAFRIRFASPAASPGIVLSQTGLTFLATEGGPTPPTRNITVLGGGAAIAFTAAARTLGTSGWLSISAASGTTGTAGATILVTANPTGLAAGDHFGEITFTARSAPNSPQTASVVLRVVDNFGPLADPVGFVFTAAPGSTAPAAQTVVLANLARTAVTYTSSTVFSNGTWFTLSPASGTVPGGAPARVTITPSITGLAAGVYPAATTFTFGNGTTQRVTMVLVVAAGGGSGLTESVRASHSTCTSTRLIPVSTLLPSSFSAVTAFPTPIEAIVVDDCGHAISKDEVLATFSNGDSALSMVHVSSGRWTGTWTPRNARTADLTVTLDATQSDPLLSGSTDLTGAATASSDAPAVVSGGLVSSASFTGPPAPGTIAALFGDRLATATSVAGGLPLPVSLEETSLVIGGKVAPLIFASSGQINAVIPFDVASGARVPVVVKRGTRQSSAGQVTLAAVQPAVFTTDLSGAGQGHIYSAAGLLADAANPADAGETVVVYCSGLGPVDPAVEAGSAAPASTLSRTTNPVTATIGGVEAPVSFAGLTPGFSGLYQVNVQVPGGLTAGEAVLVLTVAGVPSPDVSLRVR